MKEKLIKAFNGALENGSLDSFFDIISIEDKTYLINYVVSEDMGRDLIDNIFSSIHKDVVKLTPKVKYFSKPPKMVSTSSGKAPLNRIPEGFRKAPQYKVWISLDNCVILDGKGLRDFKISIYKQIEEATKGHHF